MWDRELIRSRPWTWLRERIEGLVTKPPVAYIRVSVDESHDRWSPVWGTRVQQVVNE